MPQLTLSGNEITDAVRAAAVRGDGGAIPGGVGIWEATTNLVPNGGGETNATGFNNNQASSVARSAATAKFGVACLMATCIDNTRVMSVEWKKDGAGTRIPALPATTYSFSVFNRDGGGYGKSAQLKAICMDSGGATLATLVGAVKAVPANWQGDGSDRNSITFTTPANTASVRLTWTATTNNALNDTYFFDGVQLEALPAMSPYVETNGATATRNAARVQAPGSLLAAAHGWVAARLEMCFPSASPPAANAEVFEWRTDVNNRIHLRFNLANSMWEAVSTVGGVETVAQVATAFNIGDLRTIIMTWGAFGVAVSLNGAAFVTVAAALPAPPGANFDIGSAAGAGMLDSRVRWFAAGVGALTNANAVTYNGFGSTPPNWPQLVGTPTFLWDGKTAYYAPIALPAPGGATFSAKVPATSVVWPPSFTPLPANARFAGIAPSIARNTARAVGVVQQHPLATGTVSERGRMVGEVVKR